MPSVGGVIYICKIPCALLFGVQVLEQHNALLDAADKFREEMPAEVADCCR